MSVAKHSFRDSALLISKLHHHHPHPPNHGHKQCNMWEVHIHYAVAAGSQYIVGFVVVLRNSVSKGTTIGSLASSAAGTIAVRRRIELIRKHQNSNSFGLLVRQLAENTI